MTKKSPLPIKKKVATSGARFKGTLNLDSIDPMEKRAKRIAEYHDIGNKFWEKYVMGEEIPVVELNDLEANSIQVVFNQKMEEIQQILTVVNLAHDKHSTTGFYRKQVLEHREDKRIREETEENLKHRKR